MYSDEMMQPTRIQLTVVSTKTKHLPTTTSDVQL